MDTRDNITLIDEIQFETQLEQAQQDGKPFMFLRLGDGEGALLDFDEQSLIDDILYLNEHFGRTVSIEQLYQAKQNLVSATRNADILGVRNDIVNVDFDCALMNERYSDSFLETFRKQFHLRKTEQDISAFDAIRVAKLYKQFNEMQMAKQTLCSQWISFDYFLNGGMTQLMLNADKVGLVTARASVAKNIEKATGKSVSLYQVPDKSARQGKQKAAHFPEAYNEICDAIQVDYPGMPFIVGAGLIGKGYCEVIKAKGGIALDVGALIDCWAGIYSRPKVIEEKLEVKRNIFKKKKMPKELEMSKENVERLAKIYKARKQQ
ncbi:hypothetical protein [Alteromonas confluentis]|uniref:Uncharacterized protein n=1 Tax=Alteromonas confluentis TaxID=1656094 RepID=A0A1E7ZA63_9ALTE|nr:hypothetical protein [Alteromonas confluentis]OFC70425.1 hypothetical protein BFC18_14780 [Alteromonas confluentis]